MTHSMQELGKNIAYLMICPNPSDGLKLFHDGTPAIYIKSGDATKEQRTASYDTDNPSYYACWWNIHADSGARKPGKVLEDVLKAYEKVKRSNHTEWYFMKHKDAHDFADHVVELFAERFKSSNNKIEEGAMLDVENVGEAEEMLQECFKDFGMEIKGK